MQVPSLTIIEGDWDIAHTVTFSSETTAEEVMEVLHYWSIV